VPDHSTARCWARSCTPRPSWPDVAPFAHRPARAGIWGRKRLARSVGPSATPVRAER
jgi:hypothetical protein